MPRKVCRAKTRAGTPCKQVAGWGTSHVGTGRCKLHGGATPIKHGRYSNVQREHLGELIEQMQDDPAPLDVLPELATARALLADYIERYDALRDALLSWHTAIQNGKSKKPPPTPPDVSDVIQQLERVARIAQREKRLRLDDAISRKDLVRVLSEMQRIVEEYTDHRTMDTIRDEWRRIALE